jgi:AcrR family transcriptional regulator
MESVRRYRDPQVKKRTVKAAVKHAPLVQERRDRLIKAAIAVIKDKGFHETTMRDIGRHAGMTQGTIYNYVTSKDDVLYLVCDRLVAEYQEETRKALAATHGSAERVRAAARAVAEVIYAHQDELLLIYQNTHLLDRKSLRVILARVDGFVRVFEELIAEAANDAKVAVKDTYLAANIFTFLPTMIALRRWAFGRNASREVIVDGVADFLVRGLGLAPKA